LLAAAALMVDYLLNVAVGILAGVGALTSPIPVLHPYTFWLCLSVLLVITVMNLRGTSRAALHGQSPTYLFVASLGFILVWGTYKMMAAHGQPEPVVAPPHIPKASEAVTLWLLLRAFASGCTAVTGVEAVSNGVNAFAEPKVRYAHGKLAAIVIILARPAAAWDRLWIAYVARGYGVLAMDRHRRVIRAFTATVAPET
jgi:amino acid transporter